MDQERMNGEPDPAAIAREIVDSNLYLVLGTADADGRPWVSPVYFAHRDYREYYWVSWPERKHSRNVATRRDVSVVIFDSSVPISTGRGVYMTAVAEELAGEERAESIEVFSQRAQSHGGAEWTLEQVQPPANIRLYRAVPVELWVMYEDDRRVPVTL